jgi:LPS export ABC transporter protein LptC/lipopolysaccharide transport protein LptA
LAKKFLIILSALVAFAVLLSQVHFSWLDKLSVPEVLTDSEILENNLPQQVMSEVHLVESNSKSRDWELKAKAAKGYNNEKSWQLEQVTIDFYQQNIKLYNCLAKEGKIEALSKDIELSGAVRVTSSNGYVFTSEKVNYFANEKLLKSPGDVRVTSIEESQTGQSTPVGVSLDGKGMVAEVKTGIMKIFSDVRGNWPVDPQNRFKVVSQQAIFTNKSRTAVFINQVKITNKDLILMGPKATFIYGKDNQFEKLFMEGGVQVYQGEKQANSRQLEYSPQLEKVILDGDPVIREKGDEVFGDRITLLENGRKWKVEKLKAKLSNTGNETSN